eukprot:s2095_g8.t1
MLSLKSHGCLGLALTVFEFSHLDFSSLLQVFARPESPHSVFSRSRSGLTASAPGGMLSGFLLPLRSSSQPGFSPTAFGFQHLGLVATARNMARLDFVAFATGSSRCDSLPSALGSSLPGSLLFLQSLTYMGFSPPVPRHVSPGPPPLSRSFGRFEFAVLVFEYGRCGFLVSLRSSVRLALFVPVFGVGRSGSLLSVPNVGHMDLSLMPRSSTQASLVVLLLGMSSLGSSSSLHGPHRLAVMLLISGAGHVAGTVTVQNEVQAGSTTSVHSDLNAGCKLFVFGGAHLSFSIFPRSFSRADLLVSLFNAATMGPSALLRCLAWLDSPVPATGTGRLGSTMSVPGNTACGSSPLLKTSA